MEDKFIKLCNVSSCISLAENKSAKISSNIRHLCLQLVNLKTVLYSISRNNEVTEGAIWESSGIKSCIFSDEGNEFMAVSVDNAFKLYKLFETSVVLLQDINQEEMSLILGELDVELNQESDVKLHKLTKKTVIMFVNNTWLIILKCSEGKVLIAQNKIEVSSCVTVDIGQNYIYTLTAGGNVSAYDQSDGRQLGVVHLYAMVPPSRAMDVLSFKHLSVNIDGTCLAVSDRASQVFLVKLKNEFIQEDTSEHLNSRWDCGASLRSFGSDVSRATNSSRIQTKILSDSISLSPSVLHDSTQNRSYKVTWDSYLQSLISASHEGSSEDQYSCMKRLPDSPPGLMVRALQFGNGELSVWYTEPDAQSGGVYYLHNLATESYIEQHVPDNTAVIPGGLVGLKDAFVSPSGLFMFLGSLSHDVLVSKMLHCMQRESLSRLLQGEMWSNLMVPLPAVVIALRQHQLDVAQLALNLHVYGLKSCISNVPFDDEEIWKEKMKKLSGDLDDLLNVILQTCEEYAKKPALREQLVVSTLEQTNRLLEFLCSIQNAVSQELVHNVMRHVVQLRKHLSGQLTLQESKWEQEKNIACPEQFSSEWQKWVDMSDEAVMQDAILKNCVPLCQVFFMQVRFWLQDTLRSRFYKYVDSWISRLLEDCDVEKAEMILFRVGKDPGKVLLDICVKTEQQQLRDHLAQYLFDKDAFPPFEMEALKFLKQIEEILDVVDFQKLGERKDAADRILISIQTKEDRLPLSVILKNSEEWRQYVLISLFFNIPGAGNLKSSLKPQFVWLYLLEHNCEDLLCTWVTCAFSGRPLDIVPLEVEEWAERLRTVPIVTSLEDCQFLSAEGLLNIFAQWTISEEMVDAVALADCMPVTKEIVLNHISKFGVFSSDEKIDMRAILKRTILNGNVMNLEKALSQKSGNVSFADFQVFLTRHLIDNNLHEIAFSCLEDFDYSEEQLAILCKTDHNSPEWFSLWLAFREMKKKPDEQAAVYHAILKTAQFLSRGHMKEYLKEHPLIVLALLVFEGVSLTEIFTSGSGVQNLDWDILSTTLQHFPLLNRAVTSMKDPSVETPDISLYQLLEGNAPFDISKLFGWQESHRIEGEELPHFTSSKLVEKYGVEYKMTYLIYLKLARPCFAACRFVIDQYRTYATLSQKRIKDAVNAAHGMALQHFDNREITAACFAFAEILGEDSNKMKVDICVAREVLKFSEKTQKVKEEIENAEAIGEMLNEMHQYNCNIAAAELLHLLEKALIEEINHNERFPIGKETVTEIAHWGLAVKFARSHGLKLPETFLKQLASENKWLDFMIFVDIYRYPLHQVQELTRSFSSLSLQEHFFHVLQVEVVSENKQDEARLVPRDARKTLYSKILPKNPRFKQQDDISSSGKPKRFTKRRREQEQQDHQKGAAEKMMGLAASLSSGSSGEETVGSSLISYNVWEVEEGQDLFLVVLKCHNAQDPLQALLQASYSLENPVLAVLATCYDVSMVVPCFCTWLIVSLPHSNSDKLKYELNKCIQDLTWTEENVLKILEEAVSCKFIRTLQLGCWIFFPDNPLNDLMDFLYEAIVMKNFEECLLRLKTFKAAYLNLKNNRTEESTNFINDSMWLGHVAVQLCKVTVSLALTSLQYVLDFLSVLRDGSFMEHLPGPAPDFEHLEHLINSISLTGVFPNMEALIKPTDSSEHEDEVNHCLKELSRSKQFSAALQLAAAAGLSQDPVLIEQWSDKFEQSCKRSLGRDFMGFWKKCDDTFHVEKVHTHTAAKFFQKHAKKIENLEERFRVLQLAVHWLHEAFLTSPDTDTSALELELTSVELLMWNCWLQEPSELPIHIGVRNPEILHITKNRILEMSRISNIHLGIDVRSEEEKKKIHVLVGKLLDLGNLVSASRVETMYHLKNQDLRILLLCLGLAEGTVSPYELTAEQRLLFSEGSTNRTLSHRRRALISSISTLSHSPGTNNLLTDYVEIPPRDRQDTLIALEKLTGRLEHGISVGNRVVMCYRVAMNLDLNYLDVLVMREPLNLLKTALADDCLNKFIVASDIITAAQINSKEVAEFMAREILEAVSKSKLKGEISNTAMWGIELELCFHLVLDVCRDQAALGNELLALASQTTSSRIHGFHNAHVIAVELVIYAHNCFVAALNMEGISSVLHMCHSITNKLSKKEEWTLMVRLLTGVERYTEMQYILKILYEREQFEYLLAKGLDKIKGLKVAVIDFLKKRCPGDRKLCEMVTLRFGMFEEVARFWESDGLAEEEAVLKLTISDSNIDNLSLLPNTDAVKKHLVNAMDCFKHAAEFFIKGEMLIRAMRLVHHAELVALQRYFISTVQPGQGAPLLLKLKAECIASLVTHLLTFPQAYLVIRAYDHPVDWAAALYQHCVLDGDEVYFTSFTSSIPLSSTLVEDIVRRFQVNRNITAANARMMKKFVEQVDSLELKYRLASQLGFRDLIESLLNGPEDDVAYLKDTVWKHGFRS